MNAIYWLRSDLRIQDNAVLQAFAQEASEGVVLWAPSRSQQRAKDFRRSFIYRSLCEIKSTLAKLGATVLVQDHDIRDVLPRILNRMTFDRIYFEEAACTEEKEDEDYVRSLGIDCHADEGTSLVAAKDLPFSVKDLPEVFTNFRKQVEAILLVMAEIPAPSSLPGSSVDWSFLETFDPESRLTHFHSLIPPGEAAARLRLNEYLWKADRLRVYKETRDGILEWNDSSKLSPYLALGLISPRTIYAEILKYESERVKNQSTYWLFFELLWRDYFHFIARKWGSKLFTGMNLTQVPRAGQRDFARWKEGRTGQTFVDAHMRELKETGWMSNRGRQNVSNYLVKTMGLDWREGASYFEEVLIDYDPASNWGNWAYQAGVGQDPRNRVFDPERQAEMYDKDGAYRRRWLGRE